MALEQGHQVRDQGYVGGRHFVLSQRVRPHPGELLTFGGDDGAFPTPADIQRHEKMKVRVAVAREGEGGKAIFANGYSQFLF